MSNIEYINQARKLLTEDYKSKHTAEYNNWLSSHKNSWMQPHIVVPFPPFIVSAALAPFTSTVTAPTEEDVVAKALELYKQSIPEQVVEKDSVPEPEETLNQPLDVPQEPIEEVVETPVEEAVAPVVTTPYVDEIYKIYQPTEVAEPTALPEPDPTFVALEEALKVVPQPAEELAKVTNTGGILPSVLQKLQDMKSKWL